MLFLRNIFLEYFSGVIWISICNIPPQFFSYLCMTQRPGSARAQELLSNASGKRIAVIGDIMLDKYFWGTVHRISPEAPVPVVDIEKESAHPGGASNVAANIRSLGAQAAIIGVLGNDEDGEITRQVLTHHGIETSGIVIDPTRPTTVKIRIIGNNQHIARLDRESVAPIGEKTAQMMLDSLAGLGENLSAIILEDYNKGVVTPFLLQRTIEYARACGISVFADPKRAHFFDYKGVTLFKPNKKETQDALGFALSSEREVEKAGFELLRRLECRYVLITLGAQGMALFEQGSRRLRRFSAKARHIADVSGAGDTAIATLAVMVAAGASIEEATTFANDAASAVCEEPGIVAISPERLQRATSE
jgi:rfaE bifunctional protein kinase chain/domain